MAELQLGVPDVLLHAACGLPAVPAAGQLSSILLSGGGGGASTDVFGLQPAEVCRVILHAGSQLNQLEVRGLGPSVCTTQQHQHSRAPPGLRCHHHPSCHNPAHSACVAVISQRLLSEVQSAVALCPAVVPQLLDALQPRHMQHLADICADLKRQCDEQQQQDEDAAAAATDNAAAEGTAQELRQLSAVDVLLLISLASQQQWTADVSLLLMQGVTRAHRWAICAGMQTKQEGFVWGSAPAGRC